ncbi:MAG TPA: hypothetical protein DCE00_02075 [Firmicutes bacterium]|jgi:TRAP-type C4-dicarboxylate transport system permease small subunit|nr:hypothetical protein [Bacillota bacterium]HAA37641.1 hypothetical protein [Bacillota bacterium]
MKKQTVLSVLLIFLFAFTLLYAGLTLSERALQQVSGTAGKPAAFALSHDEGGTWVLIFAGRTLRWKGQFWRLLWQKQR